VAVLVMVAWTAFLLYSVVWVSRAVV
jgi:hypothetical protein